MFDQVKGKLDLTFENLGEKKVKKIAELITVYRVVLGSVSNVSRWICSRFATRLG